MVQKNLTGAQTTISTTRLDEVKLWPFKDLSKTFSKIRGTAGIDAQSDLYAPIPPHKRPSIRDIRLDNPK